MPQGDWYKLFTDEKINGAKEITDDFPSYKLPVYIKASAIIPTQSLIQSTKEKPSDTLFLHIYNGKLKNLHLDNSNSIVVNDCNCKLLNELDNLSDIYDPNFYQQLLTASQKTKQQQVVIDNFSNELNISW